MRAILLTGVMAFALAAPALADDTDVDAREASCGIQGDIAQQAADYRRKGRRERKTIELMTEGKNAVDEAFRPAVPLMVGWVYTLPREQLREDIAGAYKAACMAYDG